MYLCLSTAEGTMTAWRLEEVPRIQKLGVFRPQGQRSEKHGVKKELALGASNLLERKSTVGKPHRAPKGTKLSSIMSLIRNVVVGRKSNKTAAASY